MSQPWRSGMAVRRSDPGDVEAKRGDFHERLTFWCHSKLTPEASGILRLLR
ncbi:hypothetical protein CXB51_020319 [Gossypium anomalum]|uniref:Uncharacterized protein n=1 Tax=Gossypium anomalum TaxID=47600 RepID=A0A8J6CX71_9ROSI|nr:hypothetical protein CXB51_020319 [Gossypium anomalum]